MKILLLTDIPPCKNYTGGLVLDRLVRFLPLEKIAICSIVNPHINPSIPKEFETISQLYLKKPREKAKGIISGKIGKLIAFAFELKQAAFVKRSLLPQIVNFAKAQKVEAVWVVLQGQTLVRLARQVSHKLSLPLYTQINYPFDLWLSINKIDSHTQRRLLKEFDNILTESKSCATASLEMSKNYSIKYGIKNVPVIASLPKEYAKAPSSEPYKRDEFIIAIAGQFYAHEEWQGLIQTLNKVNWFIAGRKIRLRIIGDNCQILTQQPANVEYLGWHSQENLINLLADSDLLYMPCWFSINCFPSNLVAYLASGRPVFCHAPFYSSPAKYLAKNNAGFICISQEISIILEKLEQALTDTNAYSEVTRNGSKCFQRDFTLERMKECFYEFLGLENFDRE